MPEQVFDTGYGETAKVLTVTTSHDTTTGTWVATGDDVLVVLPARHVTQPTAAVLGHVWTRLLHRDGPAYAGAGARIVYDRSRAATSVRVAVQPGLVVGTLPWHGCTAHGAATIQAVAWSLHRHLTSSQALVV